MSEGLEPLSLKSRRFWKIQRVFQQFKDCKETDGASFLLSSPIQRDPFPMGALVQQNAPVQVPKRVRNPASRTGSILAVSPLQWKFLPGIFSGAGSSWGYSFLHGTFSCKHRCKHLLKTVQHNQPFSVGDAKAMP